MIAIRTGRVHPEAGTGPKTMSQAFYFDSPVSACWVGLAGYRVGYDSGDHHVQTVSVELTSAIRDTEFGRGVVVEATLLLRDRNGDDRFSGWVDFVLFVELADGIRPPVGPASDLRPR